MTTNGPQCLPNVVSSSVVDHQGCWNVVLTERVQQLLSGSSHEECEVPVDVELELVEGKSRRSDCGVLGQWLGDLLRRVDGWKLKEDEDLVQDSKPCGGHAPMRCQCRYTEEEDGKGTNV